MAATRGAGPTSAAPAASWATRPRSCATWRRARRRRPATPSSAGSISRRPSGGPRGSAWRTIWRAGPEPPPGYHRAQKRQSHAHKVSPQCCVPCHDGCLVTEAATSSARLAGVIKDRTGAPWDCSLYPIRLNVYPAGNTTSPPVASQLITASDGTWAVTGLASQRKYLVSFEGEDDAHVDVADALLMTSSP